MENKKNKLIRDLENETIKKLKILCALLDKKQSEILKIALDDLLKKHIK